MPRTSSQLNRIVNEIIKYARENKKSPRAVFSKIYNIGDYSKSKWGPIIKGYCRDKRIGVYTALARIENALEDTLSKR